MTVSVRTAVEPPLAGFKTTAEYDDIHLAPFPLGTKVRCNDGSVWRFVRATAAKTIGLVYMINEAWLVGDGIDTEASNSLPQYLGVPEATSSAPSALDASATYTYFWIQTGGSFAKVTVGTGVADNALAYTSANATGAGNLDDGDDSGNIVMDLKFTAAASAGATTTAYSNNELTVCSA